MDHSSTPAPLPALLQSRLRLILQSVLALNIALALGYAGLWLLAVRQGLTWRADFSAFYTGWFMVREGAGADLYDLSAQAAAQQTILNGRSFADGLLPYVNPPHLTLPFVPLAGLPLSAAYGVWALIQIALIGVCIRLLLELTADLPRAFALQGVAAFLAFPALSGTLLRGTFSLLLLVALLLAYRALRAGRDGQAGLWLLLVSLKPQLLLAPGALLVGARRLPALISLCIGGFALAAAATAAFGLPIWGAYLHTLAEVNTYFGRNGIDPAQMPNLRGVLTNLLGADQVGALNALSSVVFAVSGLALIRLWWGVKRLDSPEGALCVALSLTVGLFVSPHLYSHDAVLLVLPLVLLGRHLCLHTPRAAWAGFLLIAPWAFLLGETLLGPLFQAALIVGLIVLIRRELRAYHSGALIDV